MKVLIEDISYSIDKVCDFVDYGSVEDSEIIFSQVGYCFSPKINDVVMFLPKVILDKQNLVFGKYRPEDIIDVELSPLQPSEKDFLYGFSVWVYRALKEFKRLNPRSSIIKERHLSELDKTSKQTNNTYLELILAILKYAHDYRDYFMFVSKNIHSGNNRIHWRKTITTQQAVLSSQKAPLYVDIVNRKRFINFDEELLVIFYSIVNYVCETYGFKSEINCNYQLITGAAFKQLTNGLGLVHLRQIKYKYFSDKAIAIWNVCYDFFICIDKIRSSNEHDEHLLASSFHTVFEAMVDELISDQDLIYLKGQKDGKKLDHIYRYASLLDPETNIFYIADSKYYRTGEGTQGESRYKQYTYARNLIDEMVREKFFFTMPYRDPQTDGYNIVPNFFIGAEIDKEHNYSQSQLKEVDKSYTWHFKNRLFDRDTLWLSHFSINFLYVLSVYATGNSTTKIKFKEDTRLKFREAILRLINSHYIFRYIKLSANIGNHL